MTRDTNVQNLDIYIPLSRMSVAATRPQFWQSVRRATDRFFGSLPLPHIHPDIISALGVLTAVGVFFMLKEQAPGYSRIFTLVIAWILLLVHLLLDGADGAIARRFHFRKNPAQARRGELIDLTADRLSEGIIFLAPGLFFPWFIFFLMNSVCAFFQFKTHRALVQPLRIVFFIALSITLVIALSTFHD